MKNHSYNSIGKLLKIDKKEPNKNVELMQVKHDTCERCAAEENARNSLNHLKFHEKKVKFYDEDVEKMKGMSIEKEVEYMAELKATGRYTYIEE
jgi:hypothetical protein